MKWIVCIRMALITIYQCLREHFCGYHRVPNDLDSEQQALLELFRPALRRARRSGFIRWVLITDYTPEDPATSKVVTSLEEYWGQPCGFNTIAVRNYDTLAVSYNAMTQLLAPKTHLPDWVVGYLNVAPIGVKDCRDGGHLFYVVLLSNGHVVFSPNSGYSLSLLLPYAVAIAELDFKNEAVPPPQGYKGQFRSWWYFPQSVARFLRGDFSKVTAVWTPEGNHHIPPAPPSTRFAVPDNFNNMKLTMTSADAAALGWKPNEKVSVFVDDEKVAEAVFCNTSGHPLSPGTLSLEPGSGVVQARPGEPCKVYLDLFHLGGGEAFLDCGSPTHRNTVTLERVESPAPTDANGQLTAVTV